MSDGVPAPSKIIPNTFQTPNLLTDDGLLSLLTGPETKCYLVVIRKTFGWRKDRDRIAKSQIMASTGLGESAADDAMNSLVKYGLIVKTAENNPANEGNEWAPQMDDRLIDYVGLRERQTRTQESNQKRTEKARLARGGGDVPQPHHVPQPGGGDVPQPPQQPITTSILVVVNADVAKISATYEQEFGALTPMIADAIRDDCATYPADWIPEAMQIAVHAGKRDWRYVRGILKRCGEKKVRPSLNQQEKPHGNNGSGNSHRAKPSQRTSARGTGEYSQADLDAASVINALP